MNKRTHKCDEVTKDLIGEEISITGWIRRRRDHGGVIFFDVRDETGLVQVVYNPELKEIFTLAESCRNEFVIYSKGKLRARPEGTVNDNLISDGNTNDLYHSFPTMLQRASMNVDLKPGDYIGSGTVGTGCILELRPESIGGWLKKGDTVRLEIDCIGVLEKTII